MDSKQDKKNAYKEGQQAHRIGLEPDDCPHVISQLREEWLRGYRDASDDAAKHTHWSPGHTNWMADNGPTEHDRDMATGEYGAPCDPKRFGE